MELFGRPHANQPALSRRYNAKEVRLALIRLIDEHLAAYPQDLGATIERVMEAVAAEHGIIASQSSAAEQKEIG
jgi:hypothetical protein